MPALAQTAVTQPSVTHAGPPDTSGGARRGQASVFAPALAGRRMADGGRVELNSDSAASDALPLGTTARIRNLRNGRVAMVRVRDRLPASGNRIISVSPKVAQFLGMSANGLAQVEVAPLAVPQRDGTLRLGSGTALSGRRAQIVEPTGSQASQPTGSQTLQPPGSQTLQPPASQTLQPPGTQPLRLPARPNRTQAP